MCHVICLNLYSCYHPTVPLWYWHWMVGEPDERQKTEGGGELANKNSPGKWPSNHEEDASIDERTN